MQWFNNLTVRNKLLLLISIPLLALLYFSLTSTVEKYQISQRMQNLDALAQLSTKLGAAAHELQKERGMTAGFLSSKGVSFASTLPTQQKDSNQAISTLNSAIKEFNADSYPSMPAGLAKISQALEQLPGMRANIKTLSIPGPEAIAYYTQTITALLSIPRQIPTLSSNSEISLYALSYASLLQTKEYTGIERALLANAFSADMFSPQLFSRYVANGTKIDTFTALFNIYANDKQRKFYNTTLSGQYVDAVAAMKNAAESKPLGESLGTDPAHWFETMTGKIDLLMEVESQLSTDLTDTAARIKSSAEFDLFLYASLTLTSLLAAISLSMLTMRRISQQLGGEPVYAAQIMQRIAKGDLTVQVNVAKDDNSSLLYSVKNMVASLASVISEVRGSSEIMSSASDRVSETAQSISQATSLQATSVEETTASMEQMSASTMQTTENAKITDDMARKAAEEAIEGGAAVQQMMDAMTSITDKIRIIDDIAYKTNLLALNAAIEAARAGEYGRGFAVVADEVRKLAERSQIAAMEISEVADSSVGIAERAGELLNQIVPSIQKTSTLVREITDATSEQSSGASQVNTAMVQLSDVTMQNASASEELAATAEEMSSQAQQLQQLVSFFKISLDEIINEIPEDFADKIHGSISARPAKQKASYRYPVDVAA